MSTIAKWSALVLLLVGLLTIPVFPQSTGPRPGSGGGGSGDASAANQTTMITHLSAIEAAIEALETNVSTANSGVRIISGGGANDEDETQVKATAGILAVVVCRNSSTTADAYLKFTNATAASTTPGTTAVFLDVLIPAGASGNNATPLDFAFDTALTAYYVTEPADNGVTDVPANEVSCRIGYR